MSTTFVFRGRVLIDNRLIFDMSQVCSNFWLEKGLCDYVAKLFKHPKLVANKKKGKKGAAMQYNVCKNQGFISVWVKCLKNIHTCLFILTFPTNGS